MTAITEARTRHGQAVAEAHDAKQAWLDAHAKLEHMRSGNAPPSVLMDEQHKVQRLAQNELNAQQALGSMQRRLQLEERKLIGDVRRRLCATLHEQAQRIAVTLSALIESDRRAGRDFPECVALGRLFIPTWSGMHDEGGPGALTSYDTLENHRVAGAAFFDGLLLSVDPPPVVEPVATELTN